MEITITDYQKGLPQDIKFAMIEKGYDYVGSEQLGEKTVKMVFQERKRIKVGDKVRRFAGTPQRATGGIGEVVEVGGGGDGRLIGVEWGGVIGLTYKDENDLIVVN